VIYKFSDLEHFHHWEQSETRKRFLQQADPLIEPHGRQRVQQLTGLETWFNLPGEIAVKPPMRWKMVVVTTIGIYPIGLIYQAYLTKYMLLVPLLLRPVVLSLLLTPALTYVIMPNLTKLFKNWLYPQD
jgi:antibiotic biosynthesis monooxygenase (ABM) superfamily enzyme